ncbi:hypothetical protein KKB10_05875 [Patescibacteria group bacterium]|nr:hypothetical protein [Patescibacteria group bacterium]MBU1075624.1 hypothetical protein [Patescibacteria group bacterium]MBU1951876.1 hypothetical protein [Patescibacteria group bacterium]
MEEEKNLVKQENHPVKKEKKEKVITLKVNSNLITIVALFILIIISIAQATQLNFLKNKISAGEVQAATTSATTNSSKSTTSGTTSPATNLNDLPDMVGGC